jgi:hypothetical protein
MRDRNIRPIGKLNEVCNTLKEHTTSSILNNRKGRYKKKKDDWLDLQAAIIEDSNRMNNMFSNKEHKKEKSKRVNKRRIYNGVNIQRKVGKIETREEVKEIEKIRIDETYVKLLEIREKYKDEIKIHGEQTSFKEGFIYIIVNPKFKGWIKAGMSIDYEARLKVYNQYDPTKSFVIKQVRWVEDRRKVEEVFLKELMKVTKTSEGEWFKIDEEIANLIFHTLEVCESG